MARPRSPKGRARRPHERLAVEYPDAECELGHRNPYELLAATILSAQATDVSVNKATRRLFPIANTPRAILDLGEEGLNNGVRIKTSTFARPYINSQLHKGKVCGHYVNSILASHEARNSGCDEALLLATEGFVAEGGGEKEQYREHGPRAGIAHSIQQHLHYQGRAPGCVQRVCQG